MDARAITKAESRLRVATEAAKQLTGRKSYGAFVDAWYSFLVAAKNVYSILEQGSKSNPQSRQWFGSKKRERRADPLLQYIFIARDADEHGIDAISEPVPGRVSVGVAKPGFSTAIRLDGTAAAMTVTSLDGKPVLIERTEPHVKLIAVTSRDVTMSPPTMHKGQPIVDQSPFGIANLAMVHLTGLLAEARTLVGH